MFKYGQFLSKLPPLPVASDGGLLSGELFSKEARLRDEYFRISGRRSFLAATHRCPMILPLPQYAREGVRIATDPCPPPR